MLVLAGGAVDDSHHRWLLDFLKRRNLDETVRFLGPTSRDQVTRLYRHAMVYVTTSFERFIFLFYFRYLLDLVACQLPPH